MERVLSEKEIVDVCEKIGAELTKKFKGGEPIVACVLKGACPFHNELIKHIKLPILVDYIRMSSYNGGFETSGNVKMKKDFEYDITGRDVIIVEDIIDSGLTMSTLKPILESRNPKSITFVTMLDKPSRRKVEFKADYVGKTIDDLFVLGFGLDVDEKYRNLRNVYTFDPNYNYFEWFKFWVW